MNLWKHITLRNIKGTEGGWSVFTIIFYLFYKQSYKSTHPRKIGNHETVHRPPVRPHHRKTNVTLTLLASL